MTGASAEDAGALGEASQEAGACTTLRQGGFLPAQTGLCANKDGKVVAHFYHPSGGQTKATCQAACVKWKDCAAYAIHPNGSCKLFSKMPKGNTTPKGFTWWGGSPGG